MPARRRPRRTAWIALVAILLSMLPTAGAHFLGVTASFGADSDYCSTIGARGARPALPSPSDHGHRLSHCEGCPGSAGNGVALTREAAPTIPPQTAVPAIVALATPVPSPVDLIAAPPRGPPHSA